MNIAIRAATLQCAQSRNGQMHAFSDSDGLYPPHTPAAPAERSLSFLGQHITLPYFNTFAAASSAQPTCSIFCINTYPKPLCRPAGRLKA